MFSKLSIFLTLLTFNLYKTKGEFPTGRSLEEFLFKFLLGGKKVQKRGGLIRDCKREWVNVDQDGSMKPLVFWEALRLTS